MNYNNTTRLKPDQWPTLHKIVYIQLRWKKLFLSLSHFERYRFRPMVSTAPWTHPKLSISSSPITFKGLKDGKWTCLVWFCSIVRTMVSFFLGKRKINFKHLIASWVDVGANPVGAKLGATFILREKKGVISDHFRLKLHFYGSGKNL